MKKSKIIVAILMLVILISSCQKDTIKSLEASQKGNIIKISEFSNKTDFFEELSSKVDNVTGGITINLNQGLSYKPVAKPYSVSIDASYSDFEKNTGVPIGSLLLNGFEFKSDPKENYVVRGHASNFYSENLDLFLSWFGKDNGIVLKSADGSANLLNEKIKFTPVFDLKASPTVNDETSKIKVKNENIDLTWNSDPTNDLGVVIWVKDVEPYETSYPQYWFHVKDDGSYTIPNDVLRKFVGQSKGKTTDVSIEVYRGARKIVTDLVSKKNVAVTVLSTYAMTAQIAN